MCVCAKIAVQYAVYTPQRPVNTRQHNATAPVRRYQQSLVARSYAFMKGGIKRCLRLLQLYQQGGFPLLKAQVLYGATYRSWIALYDTLSAQDRKQIAKRISEMPITPRISVVLMTGAAIDPHLAATVRSLQHQQYPEWEAILATALASEQALRSALTETQRNDSRIRIHTNNSASQATRANSAASAALGELLFIVPEGYQLNEHALFTIAKAAVEQPEAHLFYGDEDSLDAQGTRHSPRFKPCWDHELLLGMNYIGGTIVIRRSHFKQLGGFRDASLSSYDWDLLLRFAESSPASAAHHVPHVLTHRQHRDASHAESATPSAPLNFRFIEEHLARLGLADAHADSLPDSYRCHIRVQQASSEPKVSLIIPTRNHLPLLSTCIDGIVNRTDYSNLEIIVVDNRSDEPEVLEYLHRLSAATNITVIRDDGEFNFARINNNAAQHASGEIIGFINNDIEICTPSWLRSMVAAFTHHGVAAVGARLLYPDHTIQHAGVTLGIGGVADHLYRYKPRNFEGLLGELVVARNVSAVTAACMLVRKSIFDSLGGFDATSLAVAYNDVDLCLRIKEAGHLILCIPEAELIHHESKSRGHEDSPEKQARFKAEYQAMQRRWGSKLAHDPFYSPNLSLQTPYGELAFPPRTPKPWA